MENILHVHKRFAGVPPTHMRTAVHQGGDPTQTL